MPLWNRVVSTLIFNKNFNIIFQALQDEEVVLFSKNAFIDSYKRNFRNNKDSAIELINTSFDLLVMSGKTNEYAKLVNAVEQIHRDIFKTEDDSFWFTKQYKYYKSVLRPIMEEKEVVPFLKKNDKILDFGTGPGSLAVILHNHGFDISATDIKDYRFQQHAKIVFRLMKDSTQIPFTNNSFDVSLIRMVLHHINKRSLDAILCELKRVSKRLIIEESIYGVSKKDTEITKRVLKQLTLQSYFKLSCKKQFLFLAFMDFFTNILVFGKADMTMPFAYKTVNEWKDMLNKSGFKINTIQFKGFEKERVTPDCRALIVCEAN